MFKLLPQQEKHRLQKEYRLRLAIVTLSFFLFAEFIGAVSLLPAFFISKVKDDQIIVEQKALGKLLEDEKDPQLAEDLEKAKNQIKQLVIDEKRVAIATLFETVVTDRPQGIVVKAFELTRKGEGESELRIVGVAPSRDALVQFSKILEKEALFSKVELPVSDLARSKEIPFTIKLNGTF